MRRGAEELIRVQDRYYILASSSRIDDRTRVLKHGDTFAVFDRFGDIAPVGFGELGLYHDGTRFLSRLGLTLGGQRPLLLGSTVSGDNSRLIVDLTNHDLHDGDTLVVPRGALHVSRESVLWQGVCYERLRIANYGRGPVRLNVRMFLDADFSDIFEVRGVKRPQAGRRFPVTRETFGLAFRYQGLDGVMRVTRVVCSAAPAQIDGGELGFELEIEEHGHWELGTTIACEIGGAAPPVHVFDDALVRHQQERARLREQECRITTSNELFNDWIERSSSDLHMLITDTACGPYPYAGVPWFIAPFGRDGIITALQTLWINPEIARGVLSFLAAHQADHVDDARDAQPGKILHEARGGELPALGLVPFAKYYGSVDSTPLFIMLAGAHYECTGDLDLASRLWPHVVRALEWMGRYGDADADGLIEFSRCSPTGLVQQGWKDSYDSVFHADGTLAEGPIALCEVQGYAYAAYRAAAMLATVLDRSDAEQWNARAEVVRAAFEDRFWCEELSTYALALDGRKRPCRVRTSNPGHCLMTGIVREERAARVVQSLMADDSHTGWGIRTVSSRESRYNPMSYHNGSIWPHDNAMIGVGFVRYGFADAALSLLVSQFEASLHFDLHRTPELYCGFPRHAGAAPVLYPVACAPQAWSAGAMFMLLQSCLGLSIDGPHRRIVLRRPMLPECVERVRLRGLKVADASADLDLERHHPSGAVVVEVPRREGAVEVTVIE
jgi:glycogen debranching enzyme